MVVASHQSLQEQLGGLEPKIRPELRFTRSVIAGEPCYVLRDPITGRVHKMPQEEYDVLCRLAGAESIEDVFADLVSEGVTTECSEEEFYRFVLSLHDLGIVTLPIGNGPACFRRYDRRRLAARSSKIWNFLFLQVPLISPDAFLERTVHYARPLFTRTAFLAWMVLMGIAAFVLSVRWSDFDAPLLTMLELENLPWLLGVLVALKVVHEFGHAYACKALGGSVPEMGVVLIVATPLAYVDATAAWNFPKRRERIFVSLAGMYVESIIAALALLVWAMTSPSLVNTVAYQTFVLASVVTLMFNLNPLMRFDGYYVLSDLIDVPNLRQRAQHEAKYVFDRFVLGLRNGVSQARGTMRAFLVAFGISCQIYRVALVLSICTMIALQFYFIGIALALYYVGKSVLGFTFKSLRYLLFSEETASARPRAVAVACAVFFGMPALGSFVPFRVPVNSHGVVGSDHEEVLRVTTPGFVELVAATPGDPIGDEGVVARLVNEDVTDAHEQAVAELGLAKYEYESLAPGDPQGAEAASVRLRLAARFERDAARRVDALNVRGNSGGRVLRGLDERSRGRFLGVGEEIAVLGSGAWVVRFLLEEADFVLCQPEIGDRIECRSRAHPTEVLSGEIASVAVAGSRRVDDLGLTSLGGGEIVIDGTTREAIKPYFEVTVLFENRPSLALRHGMVLSGLFSGPPRPWLQHAYRGVLRFANSLREG